MTKRKLGKTHFGFSPLELNQPHEKHYWRTVWVAFPFLNIYILFLITAGSENKYDVALHLITESLLHWILLFILSCKCIKGGTLSFWFYSIRFVIHTCCSFSTQYIGGPNAPVWLWNSFVMCGGWLCWGLTGSCFVVIDFFVESTILFIQMYVIAGTSLFDSIVHTSLHILVGIILCNAVWYIQKTQSHIKMVCDRNDEQNEHVEGMLSSLPEDNVLVMVDKSYKILFMKNNLGEKGANEHTGKSLWSILDKTEAFPRLERIFETGIPDTWVWKKDENKYFGIKASAIFKDTAVRSLALVFSDITNNVLAQKQKAEKEKYEIESKAKSDFIASLSHEIRNPLQSIIYSLQLFRYTQVNEAQKQMIEDILDATKLLSSIIRNVLDMSKIESGMMELDNGPMNVLSIVETVAESFCTFAYKKGLEFITYVDPKIPTQLLGDSARIAQVLNNFVSNAVKFTSKGHIFLSAELDSLTSTTASLTFKCIDTGIGVKEKDQKRIFEHFVQLKSQKRSAEYKGWGLGLSIVKRLSELMNGKVGVKSQVHRGSEFWFSATFQRDTQTEKPVTTQSQYEKVIVVCENETLCNVLEKYIVNLNARFIKAGEVNELTLYNTPNTAIILDESQLPTYKPIDHEFDKVIVISKPRAQQICLGEKMTELKEPVKYTKLVAALCNRKDEQQIASGIVAFQRWLQGRRVRVLIVEDCSMIQSLLKCLLQKYGLITFCASNGAEALEIVKNTDTLFDLILMDLIMPIMGGIEATKQIRSLKDPVKARTPIVALSANALQSTVKECFDCGMDQVLSKPVDVESLIKCIHECCAKGEQIE